MKEYIEREVLLKAVEKMDRLDKETKIPYKYDKQGYLILINTAPTADVVEVCRCGECKHFITDSFNRTMCNRTFTMLEMNNNDFCSYGERKDK